MKAKLKVFWNWTKRRCLSIVAFLLHPILPILIAYEMLANITRADWTVNLPEGLPEFMSTGSKVSILTLITALLIILATYKYLKSGVGKIKQPLVTRTIFSMLSITIWVIIFIIVNRFTQGLENVGLAIIAGKIFNIWLYTGICLMLSIVFKYWYTVAELRRENEKETDKIKKVIESEAK